MLGAGWCELGPLRCAPVVNVAYLVDAADSAVGSAAFFGEEFALDVGGLVFGERNARVAALLGAVVDQPKLADIDIAGTGPAAPVVRLAVGYGFLEVIEARVAAARELTNLVPHSAFGFAEGLELARAVVDDADGRGESQTQGPLADRQRISGIGYATTDDGVDVDMEVCMLCQHLKLRIEDFEAFLRNVIRHDVVDRNLHVVEAGAVQALDAVGHQQIPVGDHAGNRAGLADARDDAVKVRMEQRLAAGDSDNRRAKPSKLVDAALHLFNRNGVRVVIELIAVSAGKVATAHRHDVRHVGVARRGKGGSDRGQLAYLPSDGLDASPRGHLSTHRRRTLYFSHGVPSINAAVTARSETRDEWLELAQVEVPARTAFCRQALK